jgi:hypothetical protein
LSSLIFRLASGDPNLIRDHAAAIERMFVGNFWDYRGVSLAATSGFEHAPDSGAELRICHHALRRRHAPSPWGDGE